MMDLVRRLRGLLGIAASWGVTWFGAATVYFGVETLGAAPLGMILFSAAGVGVAGFLAGAGFSVVLSNSERRRHLVELSAPRVGVWGALGALLVGGLFAVELPAAELVPLLMTLGVLGGVSAAGTVALAKRSDDEWLTDGGRDEGLLRSGVATRMD